MVRVSVIVPIYNVEKYLQRALNSLVHQTLDDIEIICINDGSTDSSQALLENFAKTDKRIKIITQKNLGVSTARNRGLECAIGEYIAFLDSDDYIDKDFLEKLYNAVVKNNCDIAAATIIRKRENSQKYRVHYETETVLETLEEKIKICDIPRCCYVWNKLYKKELIKDRKFTDGVYFEDVLWTPEVLKQSKRLVTVPDTNYYYMVTKGSIVKTPTKKKQEDNYNAKKFLINFFEENNLDLSEKYKKLTKEVKYIFKIPVLKIKERNNTETALLFGLLPIYKLFKQGPSRYVLNILIFKFKLRKNKFSNKKIQELNLLYEQGNGIQPKIYDSDKTLDELINSNRSICRFGDGEFNLINGEDLNFQSFDKNLQQRLSEILTCNADIMVGIPNVFGNLDSYKSKGFWQKYMVHNRENIYSLLNMNKQYYDSLITRVYIDTDKSNEQYMIIFDKFKSLWKEKDIVIVEGEGSRLGIGNDLFDNTNSIKRIICPAIDAFKKYNEILESCKNISKDRLFILALGPTATVLAYDLNSLGYRTLDLGHLDIEYEWFLQGAPHKVAIKNKYTNEVKNGRKLTKINNSIYEQQIYAQVKECD